MNYARRNLFSGPVLVAASLASSASGGNYTFLPLGDLAGGSFSSQANAISADGLTVVGQSNSAAGAEAFQWTLAGGMVGLGDAPGGAHRSTATGVSGDRSTVVGLMTIAAGVESFRHSVGPGLVGLGDSSSISLETRHAKISSNGAVIVLSQGDGVAALRWTAGGGLETLTDPQTGDPLALAMAVNSDGGLIAGANGPFVYLRSNTDTQFHETTNLVVFSQGVSEIGPLVVGGDLNIVGFGVETRAWYWRPDQDTFALLPSLSGFMRDNAADVSADGRVIVGVSSPTTTSQAAVWLNIDTVHSLQALLSDNGATGLEGWTLHGATDVSVDGRTIVGYGTNPLGEQEAFLATIPEPSSVVLALLGSPMAAHLMQRGMRRRGKTR